MNRWIAGLSIALLAVVSARADTPETQRKNLQPYTPYLEAPVDRFQFWSLYKWQLVGADKIVVWSTIKDAYLLTVEQPCAHLEWASGIGLTSQESRYVSRRLDFLTAGRDHCRIAQIEPIDYAKLLKDEGTASK